jgi:hypothetical protein
MTGIRPCDIPAAALLRAYRENDGFADCYCTDVDGAVTHAQFVEAFYTTWLFKIERFILRWLVKQPSGDDDARRLARGDTETFAAWRVEARTTDQVLLADFTGRTRSWLMIESLPLRDKPGTRLYFGSAVVPKPDAKGGRRLGFAFTALLGIHRLYSHLLLSAARSKVLVQSRSDRG